VTLRAQLEHQQTIGWPAQSLMLPVTWYTNISAGSDLGFPISGDRTRINAYPNPIPGKLLFCQEVHSEFRAHNRL
jgi:hypothetical protein